MRSPASAISHRKRQSGSELKRRAHNLRFFAKIFGAQLRKSDFTGPYAKDDDEGAFRDDFDISDLSDDQIDALREALGDDDDDDDKATRQKHEVEQIADLLVMANPNLTKPAALHHLLNHRNGQALLARTRKALAKRKEQRMQSYNKPADVVRVMKGIADSGSTTITEAEATAAITPYGKSVFPDLTPDAAFAKVFEASDATGLAFRKAIAVTKGLALILPVITTDDSVNDPENALEALQALKQVHRRKRYGVPASPR
jgi:hypothetical protein